MAKSNKNSFGRFDHPRILGMIEGLRRQYQENGKITAKMIEEMKVLRELFIELEQPTIVKSIRLSYEHAQKYAGKFDPRYLDEESEQSEFDYYLDLLTNPANKYNRDEIKELNLLLKDSLEHDDFHTRPRRRFDEDEEEEELDEVSQED